MSVQEDIASKLDNNLILGFGKKNKEQKTGKVDPAKNMEFDDNTVLVPEFELHMEQIEIKKPELKEKLGGIISETSWADVKEHKILTEARS